jgi:hypothetical protein
MPMLVKAHVPNMPYATTSDKLLVTAVQRSLQYTVRVPDIVRYH